jgi:hypothetical protein
MNRYDWRGCGRYGFDRMEMVNPALRMEFETIADLQKKQRDGKQLTLAERQRISKYATEQRLKNLKKKTSHAK